MADPGLYPLRRTGRNRTGRGVDPVIKEHAGAGRGGSRRTRIVALLWALVVLEALSPMPLALTGGVAWVLAVRPRWFLELVKTVYGDATGVEDR